VTFREAISFVPAPGPEGRCAAGLRVGGGVRQRKATTQVLTLVAVQVSKSDGADAFKAAQAGQSPATRQLVTALRAAAPGNGSP
jgi:hypothetical protein